MICIDNTLLVLLFHPTAKAPNDPSTGQPIAHLGERLDHLKRRWSENNEKVIIPTPVLAEFLILAKQDGPAYLTEIGRSSNFEIVDFDQRAAIELAAIHLSERARQSKNEQVRIDAISSKAKVKFDRQIIAIAKVSGAVTIYSDDQDVRNYAVRAGIEVIETWNLPVPASTEPLLEGVDGVPANGESTERETG